LQKFRLQVPSAGQDVAAGMLELAGKRFSEPTPRPLPGGSRINQKRPASSVKVKKANKQAKLEVSGKKRGPGRPAKGGK
jgi:hypothetical protein